MRSSFSLTSSSSLPIRSARDSVSVSICGLASLISATSTCTLFCPANLIDCVSSESILIYLIISLPSSINASSLRRAIFSADISIMLSDSGDVLSISRLRIYHVKSDTNCDKSLPASISSSNSLMTPVMSPLIIIRSISEKTSVSTAPRTSNTSSYLSVPLV